MSEGADRSRGSEKPRRLEDILQSNIWDVDYEPHIKVDTSKCAKCDRRACINLCPAGCYTLLDDSILFSYEGCLECGTCRIICPKGAIQWNYPVSGRGVYYRFG